MKKGDNSDREKKSEVRENHNIYSMLQIALFEYYLRKPNCSYAIPMHTSGCSIIIYRP
jgi:hypothetical protein